MSAATFIPQTMILDLEAAHLLRSQLIDACAAIEREVAAWAKQNDVKFDCKIPVGHRFKDLMTGLAVKPKAKTATKLHKAFLEWQKVNEVRAKLAHACISIARIESRVVIELRMPGETSDVFDQTLQTDFDRIIFVVRRAKQLKAHLGQLLQPRVFAAAA